MAGGGGSEYADGRSDGWGEMGVRRGISKIAEVLGEGGACEWSELKGGHVSKVFKVRTPTQTVVAKVGPSWYHGSIARERRCLEKIRAKTDVKTPAVLHYAPADNDIFPEHEVILMEYVEGPKLGSMPIDERTHEEVGRMYRQIHNIRVLGSGPLDESLHGRKGGWKEFLADIDAVGFPLDSGMMKREEYSWLLHEIDREASEQENPSLLHGDFRWDNLIRGEAGIVPLDFQNAIGGYELYEYATNLAWHPETANHLKHYLGHEPTDVELRDIMICSMAYVTSLMGYWINGRDMDGARAFRQRFDIFKKIYESV